MLVTLSGTMVFLQPRINSLLAVFIIALHPLRESNVLLPSATLIDSTFLQPENVLSPMLVTLFGMLILVSDEQPLNALFPMLVTLFGMLIQVRDKQP